jgi:LmbE family N-acetylglucosaminyl deacetylase
MIVVAHPDDELLGLGGTIYKIKSQSKCQIKVVILGEGITSRSLVRTTRANKVKLKNHNQNILEAKQILGYDELSTYQLPDNQFDTVPLLSIIKIIENEKKQFDPELVFTHHLGDVNIDHQLTFKAVNTAFRSQPGEKFKGILTFETPSSSEWIPANDLRKFNPNIFIELNETQIDKKITAMECYNFEKRTFPHPRSPEALKNRSMMWGVTVGVRFAEPFQLIKYIFRDGN